jgi:iron(III) transport system ATP-binding protein
MALSMSTTTTTKPSRENNDRPEPYLQVRNVSKSFGNFLALDDISLDVQRGELVCFLGPSGCGKTTLLRVIAGLEEQNAGQIIQDGTDVSRLPPSRRTFGIVFQSYALFPNLTAAQNVAYGLENRRLPRPQVKAKVDELLQLVGLGDSGHKYPAQLSGGQQQRIALARAIALSPGLLLLDEPLSALDARVRASLRTEITRLQRQLNITTILVTHDQVEALTMADRIVVMSNGRIIQEGTPLEVYQEPSTPFVANFVGEMNFLPAVVTSEPGQVRCADFDLPVGSRLNDAHPGAAVTLAIRPEAVKVVNTSAAGDGAMPALVVETEFLGPFYRVRLQLGGGNGAGPVTLTADLPIDEERRLELDSYPQLFVRLPVEELQVFPTTDERRPTTDN